jgi:hypothetical protein
LIFVFVFAAGGCGQVLVDVKALCDARSQALDKFEDGLKGPQD